MLSQFGYGAMVVMAPPILSVAQFGPIAESAENEAWNPDAS
jgi:hypothetical protein